jgi:peptidoglycan/LPS O-acetylase OafA/YrhL
MRSTDDVLSSELRQLAGAGRLSLSEALGGHRNSLGLLRLVLAALVIFDHAFPLGGYGADPFWALTKGQASLGSIAVLGFFIISGYLIAKSAMSADWLQFLWRRILRIFPAYWLVLILTAVVVAPIIWVIGGNALATYFTFSPTGPVAYFVKNFTLQIGTYGIYDLLSTTTPYGLEVQASVFNGSLWTLIYEWQCYIMIGLLALAGILARARFVVPLLAAFVGAVELMSLVDWDAMASFAPVLADPERLQLTFTFLVGSSIAVYSKEILFDNRLGIFAGLLALLSLRFGAFAIVGVVAAAYFVLYLAARLPKRVQWIGAKNDYSYGVYIYGFLVQQVLAYFGVHKLGYIPFVLIALAISLGCAWVSWHLVEKRAMSLKNWGPGRGWRYWWMRMRARFAPKESKV